MRRRDAEGDASFADFATAASPKLRGTAYLLCGDWHRASDLVQEGLIRVYMNWPRLVRNGAEIAYSRKAVLSAFLDSARRRSSREIPSDLDLDVVTSADPARAVADREALRWALSKLPPRQRACIVLRYFEELDVAETAAVLGCAEGPVKSQTSRAIWSLRSMFEAAERDEIIPTRMEQLPW